MDRTAFVQRDTKETQIEIFISLDGGRIDIDTGIGFFDHMLNAFAHHGGFGLTVKVRGDLFIDCHHSIEDTGIVLGQAILKALGDKTGIKRFGSAFVPMDESLGFCSLDISGRSFLVFNSIFPQEKIGDYDACMTEEFFRAVSDNSGITLHLKNEYGKNSHHMVEALFKAFAYALKNAVSFNDSGELLSTKGVL
ncbi:MAG: imidazoleglycerol-phosphate dehydratase HisB [Clostridia bacterium]